MSDKSDEELFKELQNGQINALDILYDRLAALVYSTALQFLNREEAQDLTHDIFTYLMSKECRYNPQRGTLRTFLRIYTRSRAKDKIRSIDRANKRLQNQALIENSDIFSDDAIESISRQERVQKVQKALNQLSPQEREVLRMAYYENLSQSKIAKQLDIPLGTVKSRSRSGLLKLGKVLN